MKELSLNILDITYNSIKANAEKIEISISESISANLIQIEIKDNGHGMDHELLEKVTDPFVTTRTTRKVGLGIPLFKQSAEDTDGKFSISSKIGEGTAVYASFRLDHLDRAPIGDISSTMVSLIQANDQIHFICQCLEEGMKTSEILSKFGINKSDSNYERCRHFISTVKTRKVFKEISSNYTF